MSLGFDDKSRRALFYLSPPVHVAMTATAMMIIKWDFNAATVKFIALLLGHEIK